MALEKTPIPIVIDGGINTKTDAKLVGVNETLEQINADFDEVGAIKKREGSFMLGNSIIGTGATFSSKNPQHLIEHGNELLAITGFNDLYSFGSNLDSWNKKTGDPFSPFAFIENKFGERTSTYSPSLAEATSSLFRVVGYVTSDEGGSNEVLKATVIVQDYATNAKKTIWEITKKRNELGIDDVITDLRVEVLDTISPIIFVVYNQYNTSTSKYDLKAHLLNRNGSDLGTVTLISGSTYVVYYCTRIINNKLFVAATEDHNTKKIKLMYVNTNATIGTNATFTSAYAHYEQYYNIAIVENNSDIIVGLPLDPTSGKVFTVFGHNKTTLASTINESASDGTYLSGNPRKIEIYPFDSTNIHVLCNTLYQKEEFIYGTEYRPDIVEFVNINTITGVITGIPGEPKQFCSLASRPFTIGNTGEYYFIGQGLNPLNYRYFIIKVSSALACCGSFAVSTASFDQVALGDSYSRRNYNLPSVTVGASSELYYPASIINKELPVHLGGVSVNGVAITSTNDFISNVFVYRFEFDSQYEGISAKLGGNTYIAGASVKEYDGNQLYTQSFLDVPTVVIGEASTLPGTIAGTYIYTAIFEFVDSNGQIHRSQPAIPRKIVHTDVSKTIVVDVISFSKYIIENKPYSAIIYRTTNGGTTFYRIGSALKPTYLYGDSAASGHYDFEPDSVIVANEQLYINGGILENELLPPIKYLLTANNRIFTISSEDENLIYYSQPYLYGECVNFSQSLSMRVDAGLLNRSGKAMALATMDGKIIVFKDQSIAAFAGDGPNQAGEQNNFTDPKLISSDVGITDIKSIATTPDGLIFKSAKGIYLLDRSFNLSYIGSAVEEYNSESIKGVCHIINSHKVLFLTTNRTLVYDYLQKKWATWSWSGDALINYGNLSAFISSDRVYVQIPNLYTDGGAFYSLKIKTPWIKVSGIQNYQRLYRIILLGDYYSAHTLTVNIYYDYDDSIVETHTINPLNTDNIYQYLVKLIRQKCQAFKLEIYDNVSTGSGQGYKLSNVSLLVGQKRGLNKGLADSRKYV